MLCGSARRAGSCRACREGRNSTESGGVGVLQAHILIQCADFPLRVESSIWLFPSCDPRQARVAVASRAWATRIPRTRAGCRIGLGAHAKRAGSRPLFEVSEMPMRQSYFARRRPSECLGRYPQRLTCPASAGGRCSCCSCYGWCCCCCFNSRTVGSARAGDFGWTERSYGVGLCSQALPAQGRDECE